MAFDDIISDIPVVADEHDDRHRLGSERHAREAAAFMFALPDDGVAGFLYPWVDNKGVASTSITSGSTPPRRSRRCISSRCSRSAGRSCAAMSSRTGG